MSDEKALAPVEQKQVEFYGDELTAVRTADNSIFVPIRPICELIGVDWNGQRRRIKRDPVLAAEVRGVDVTSTPGGTQTALCLPLDYISGFLFGLNADRVRPDLRDKVIRYQRECYKVLAEAFSEGRLTADPDFNTLLQQASADAVEAYQMALAVVKLARNQILIEARLDDYGRRLEAVEATLSVPERFVTREQASRISQAVRAIGHVLSERHGRSEYGAVYGELYRNFEISAYRELPAQKYDEAMKWLNAWYQRLTNQDIPF